VDDNADNVAGAAAVGIDAIRFTDAAALATELGRRGLVV
jgi:FMN phosphatase YigB (HAD superfamily)